MHRFCLLSPIMTIPGFTSMLEDRTTYLLVATPLACTVLWLTARLFHTVVRVRRLPPGPKGFPFIGDVSHMADQDWLASPQRIDDYGDEIVLAMHSKTH